MHALTYFQGPDWKVLFPFAYKVGEHLGVPPFYFEGPDYKVSPPLLSGKWTHKDGSSSTWITPLFHKTVNEDGSLQSMHALTYFQGPDWKVLFPFAYKVGEHFGVPPLYFEGPGYKVVPPLLSGKWTHKDGSASTWITPLFHKTVNEDGSLKSMHALTYFQGPDWKVFFPFAYKVGEHFGVPPFYFEGPDYKVSPPLLSGKWTHSDGSASTWITPLFHKRVNRDGSLRSMHALAYFQGPDWKVFFPFVYKVGEHVGVPPFYFEGPDYKVSPPLLSGKWTHKDGSASTWITPLFHRTVDAEGVVKNMHALTYFQGPDWKVLFPFAYRVGEHLGVPPFYFEGPDYKVSPPLLSGKWTHKDGSSSTWITPLFHRTVNQNGTVRNMHALTYFQGPDWKVLFPFGYSVGSQGRKHGGIVPLVFWGPGYVIAPPLLPFYIRTPNADVSPILLSGRWKHSDGSASTWITPLFHKTVRRDGTVRNMHALTYFQGPDWKVLFPAYWQWKRADGGTRAIIPFLYWSATSGKGEVHRSVIPPLFWSRSGPTLDKSMSWQIRPFAWQRAGNDRELNILWRMFHYRREGAATRVMVGPLWRSERPAAGKPAAFQILGGLAARDCNYRTGSYRYRILWFIPVGRRRHFEP
jgi:ribosomal protein S21